MKRTGWYLAGIVLSLLAAEGVVRWRGWGLVPPGPAEVLRGVVVDAPPPSPTLVVLGDSIPWGYGLPTYQEAWPALVGRGLAERGTPWRVVDASIPGETTIQGWARWRRDVLPWHPRRVLIAFGLNDSHLRHTPTDDWRWAHVPQGWGARVRLWHLVRVLTLPRPPETLPTLAPRLTPKQTAQALALILHDARRAGIEAWVLTPTPTGDTFHPEWPEAVRAYQHDVYRRTVAAIREVARTWGAPLIDLDQAMSPPRPEWLQPDGIHLTAAGHREVAARVLAALTRR